MKKALLVWLCTIIVVGVGCSSSPGDPDSVQRFETYQTGGWTGTVYIRADGSVDPPNAPIITSDNITYTLTDNITVYSGDGIVVQRDQIVIDGDGYTVEGTEGPYPYYKGIYLYERENVTIRNTHVRSFNYNISLIRCSHVTVCGNNLTDGPENAPTMQIHLSYNCEIYQNSLLNNNHAVGLTFSSNNSIYENRFEGNNGVGIWINYTSNHNLVYSNELIGCGYGIVLHHDPAHNSIFGNKLISCGWAIDITENSQYNMVYENDIEDSFYGVTVSAWSPNNTFYHNNLINSFEQARTFDSLNTWDDDYPSGGNYWSDYTGVDLYSGPAQNETGSDGIGDTPYIIDGSNRDRYPLMEPFESHVPTRCVETDTGTGTVCLTTSHGSIQDLQSVPAPSPFPPGVQFPHGMFTFKITGLTPGQPVTITAEFPDPIPTRWVWWKYHNATWSRIPISRTTDPRVITFTLTDGVYPGDEDDIPGQITDQGGPGSPGSVGWETYSISKVRVLLPWVAVLLAVIAGAGVLALRRRRA